MWLFSRKNKLSDEELLQSYLRSGNKALIGELFEKHVTTVYGVCLFYLRDKSSAQDAVMQIFEKLMKELAKTEIRNFKAWLGFVVRNYCVNEMRRNKSKYAVPEFYLDFEIKQPNLEEEETIAKIREEELLQYMKEVLPGLKDKQRLCVELFYLKQKSYQAIVDETGWSLNEVKSYIQNGKRNLKLMIEKKMDNK